MNWEDANIVIKTIPMQLPFLLIGTLIFLMTACNVENIPKGELDLSYHMTAIIETSAQTDLATAEECVIDNEYVKVDSNYENAQYIDEIDGPEIYELPINDESSAMNLYYDTWQEAYAELLRSYAELPLRPDSIEIGWHFALHDINRDGTPELFLLMLYGNGHNSYRSIYTFNDRILLSLEFENFAIDGSLFSLSNGGPYIIARTDVGFGASYMRMLISSNKIIVNYYGYCRPNQNAMENYWDIFDIQEYNPALMYFYLTSDSNSNFIIDENLVDLQTFQYIFGNRDDRFNIVLYELSEYNIARIIS